MFALRFTKIFDWNINFQNPNFFGILYPALNDLPYWRWTLCSENLKVIFFCVSFKYSTEIFVPKLEIVQKTLIPNLYLTRDSPDFGNNNVVFILNPFHSVTLHIFRHPLKNGSLKTPISYVISVSGYSWIHTTRFLEQTKSISE